MTTVDIEVILKEYNRINNSSIIDIVGKYLKKTSVRPNAVITNLRDELYNEVTAVIVGDIPNYNKPFIDFDTVQMKWFVYSLDVNGPVTHTEESEDGETVISTQLCLPSPCLLSLWENLYYETTVKQNLLQYARSMMEFCDKGVDCNVISCNRVILLHGPPGTGKTSLCKALAQKLTVRLQDRFTSGLLIEINSHSLFSKWFSESGKLVNKMFAKIKEVVENSDVLVCVLIDEIESLARARDQCISGTEPSDSVRVVNAVLTQIDQIKSHRNVLILATSNISESIDLAFVDRADIKQYLGLPSPTAIYRIYVSCLEELMKAQIIKNQNVADLHTTRVPDGDISGEMKHLWRICEQSKGLSGRSLRKVPLIAHALYLQEPSVALSDFLSAIEKAVEKEILERKFFTKLKTEL